MIALDLNDRDERRLADSAERRGCTVTQLAREWLPERMDREEVDRKIANFATLTQAERVEISTKAHDDATNCWLRALDADDGGYNWGPDGPPDPN